MWDDRREVTAFGRPAVVPVGIRRVLPKLVESGGGPPSSARKVWQRRVGGRFGPRRVPTYPLGTSQTIHLETLVDLKTDSPTEEQRRVIFAALVTLQDKGTDVSRSPE